MIGAIEVQVISRVLTSNNAEENATLLGYGQEYFKLYAKEYAFISKIYTTYGRVPSRFDFLAEFPDFTIVEVPEDIEYLEDKLAEYRQHLILVETFNKIKDLSEGDVKDAWRYIEMQCEKASNLDKVEPMDIIHDADKRAQQILDYAKQKRIPTGFPEIDKAMYGGLSTVEELLVLIARTNAGKSWVCTRLMESAQKNGFPVAYYSPEMQSAYLATRFDTWRGHFENNKLYRGDYSEDYLKYLQTLPQGEAPAFVIEDKDFPDGVSVRGLDTFVKKHGIKLLVIDGISYMMDDQKAQQERDKYKHIATGLFSLSKKHGCAVVLVMQANREVKNKDDKGESIPDLYNAEGSDHPGRVATQAFGIRQIFDKHVLDIKLLKSRSANNTNPIFSYSWDINTGNMNYIPGGDADDDLVPITPAISTSDILSSSSPMMSPSAPSEEALVADDSDDIEF